MAHIHELYDFTVSAFVFHPKEPKICLVNHKKLNMWLQPGGHIELNEDPWQGLEHELLEETGLELDKCEVLQPSEQAVARGQKTLPLPSGFNVHEFNKDHKHIDLQYTLRSYTDKFSPGEDESQEIGWFDLKQITELNKQKLLFDGTFDICSWLLKKYV